MITQPLAGPIVTSTAVGTQDNFNPAGLFFIRGTITTILMNNATLMTLDGVAGGVDGAYLRIRSKGAGQVDLAHLNGGSLAANQLSNMATGAVSSLSAGKGWVLYVYDGTAALWNMVGHDQGAWIDYSATSTIVGWSSFTTKKIYYLLRGRTLSVNFHLDGTSNSAPTNFTLPYTNAVATDLYSSGGYTTDNGGDVANGLTNFSSGSNQVSLLKSAAGAFTNVNEKRCTGGFIAEVV